MNYQIEFTKKALKSFVKLPKEIQNTVVNKLNLLSVAPYATNNNVKKLQGDIDCYRLRVGDYRVLYRILNERLIIEVIHIAHRREAYS